MKKQLVVHVGMDDFAFESEEDAFSFFALARKANDTKLVKTKDGYIREITLKHNPKLEVTELYADGEVVVLLEESPDAA